MLNSGKWLLEVSLAAALILSDVALSSGALAQPRCGGCAKRHKDLASCIACIESSAPGQYSKEQRTRECKYQWANCQSVWKGTPR
jgi:hypothetical protein